MTLSLREQLAVSAPEKIPEWFKVSFTVDSPKAPDPSSLSDKAFKEFDRYGLSSSSPEARAYANLIFSYHQKYHLWEMERQKNRAAQWPWAFADAVISAQSIHRPPQ